MTIYRLLGCLTASYICATAAAQVQVQTLLHLNASGGVTLGPDGFVYVSDFGSSLAPDPELTRVYRVDPDSGAYEIFADNFEGASGAAFDRDGNFYQAEPRGNRISRIATDGTRTVVADGLNTPVGVQVDDDGNVYVCN
ncbi:MAG: ScyD/ScyE family protein, partial [Gammaproteobacteria bacterium]